MTSLLSRVTAALLAPLTAAAEPPGVVLRELIFEDPPFRECHASTIEATSRGLVCAWFAGTSEGDRDVGIWVSRQADGRWTAPLEVANGIQYTEPGGAVHRHACWNPVLFQPPQGPLLLFSKCGPRPTNWWGVLQTSEDGGATWSAPRRLPEGILGPVRAKPILLEGGALLCGSSTEHEGWRVHFEVTRDLGKMWQRIGPIHDGKEFGAIQPTLLRHRDGSLQALCRSRQSVIVEAWSQDGGRTWGPVRATSLPNPSAGIDGVTLRDGRQLLVYNHTVRGGARPSDREAIHVALSDDGKLWKAAARLEHRPGSGAEYSYPAAIQTPDGRVHVTYTWDRKSIQHVVLEPEKLESREMVGGKWPE